MQTNMTGQNGNDTSFQRFARWTMQTTSSSGESMRVSWNSAARLHKELHNKCKVLLQLLKFYSDVKRKYVDKKLKLSCYKGLDNFVVIFILYRISSYRGGKQ